MKFRERKNKGEFSVMDEDPVIEFSPNVSTKEKLQIEEQSKFIDAPVSLRLKEVVLIQKTPNFIIGKTETRNKELIKDEQSTNKPVMDLEVKPVMDLKTRNKELPEKQETRNEQVIKDKQSTNKPVMDFVDLSLDKVSSFQRKILEIIFQEIQANPFDKETRPLNIQQFGRLLGILDMKGFESLRIVILRLEKAGFIVKTMVKNGRSGWTQYSLPSDIFDQLLKWSQMYKPVIKDEQSTNKPVTKPVIADHSMYESKSLNNFKYLLEQFPELVKIGLKVEHLNNSPKTGEDLEQILTHFQHSLKANEVKVSYKLPVLLSIIKDLGKKTWVSESYLNQINEELKQNELRSAKLDELMKKKRELEINEKWNLYKMENPLYIEELNQGHSMNVSTEVKEKIAFQSWVEKNEL